MHRQMVQVQRHKQLSHRKPFFHPGQLLTCTEQQSNRNAALYTTAYLLWINGSTNLQSMPPTSPGLQLSVPRSASLALRVYASQSETALEKRLPSYCNKFWVKPSNHWVITVLQNIFQLNPSVSEDEKVEDRNGGKTAQIIILWDQRVFRALIRSSRKH